MGSVALRHVGLLNSSNMESELALPCNKLRSLARDQTHVPCIRRQILNHWTTKPSCEFVRAPPKDARCVSSLGWLMTGSGQRTIAEVTRSSGRLTIKSSLPARKETAQAVRLLFKPSGPVCACVCVKVLKHSPALKPPVESGPTRA